MLNIEKQNRDESRSRDRYRVPCHGSEPEVRCFPPLFCCRLPILSDYHWTRMARTSAQERQGTINRVPKTFFPCTVHSISSCHHPKSPFICPSYEPDCYVTVTVVVAPTLYLSTEKEGERQRGNGKGTKAPFITLTAYAWDSVLPGKG